jgi:von Willebrand factor type A domain
MSISFLTPRAALVGLAVVLPLAALVVIELRSGRLRGELGLQAKRRLSHLPIVLSIVVFAGLIAAASAQPVVERTATRYARTDAEAFIVVDTSRSMLAKEGPGKPTRFERAREAALELRSAIPDVPVGLASMTDRVLPHVFPTTDGDAFNATLDRSLAVDRPPPSSSSELRSTDYGALSALANQNFFPKRVRHRLVVVLTDGESIPVTATYLRDLYHIPPPIKIVFVRFWSETERVYRSNGKPEPQYRPDPASGAELARVASTMGGRLFGEHQLAAAIRAERADLARGRRIKIHNARRPMPLAPYSLLVAFVPLGFLLWRRNL